MELLVLVGAVVIIILLVKAGGSRSRRVGQTGKTKPRLRPVPSHRPQPGGHRLDESHLGDPKAQMEFIAKVGFEPRRLLNKSEYRVLRELEKIVRERKGGFRVMAQTSLGEVIRTSRGSASKNDLDLAFRSINSKRLDFLVIDRSGMPVIAVEYQGSGHYQNKSFMRDAVKREAVRRAGFEFIEVPEEFDPDIFKKQVLNVLKSTKKT